MKISMNDRVRVKLTSHGHDMLKKNHDELYRRLGKIPKYEDCRVDEHGNATFMLWELMREFGPYLHMGMNDHPFDFDIVVIPWN